MTAFSLNRTNRIRQRNEAIAQRFRVLEKRHPQYRFAAILELLEKEFFLSQKTLFRIISEQKVTETV